MQNTISLLFFSLLFFSIFSYAENAEQQSRTDIFATTFWNSFNGDLSSGRLEKYLTLWHENAERITPTIHAKGIEEIRATYQSYLSNFSDFHQTEIRRITQDNIAVSELITRATNIKTGEELTLPNVAIVEFDESGKVIRARVYYDTGLFQH